MARLLRSFKSKSNAGFTLIEMMLAIAGFTIVVATILAIYTFGLERYRTESDSNQAMGSGMRASAYMKRDLRNGSAIEYTYGTYTTDSNTVIIKCPSYNSNGVLENTYDYVIYDISNDTLKRTIVKSEGSLRNTETNRPIVRGVSDMHVTYIVHDFTTGNSSTIFPLSVAWSAAPACRMDGVPVTSGLSYTASNHTAYFTVPPASGAALEFIYPVIPSAGTLALVSEVKMTFDADSNISSCSSEEIDAGARLRNKR